jgi:hypothetical protein
MAEALLQAIVQELDRIGAGPDQAGEADSIGVNDESDGWASLGASEARRDLYWYGKVEVILERLARVPDGAGPEGVRAEFYVDLPDHLGPSR